MCANISEWAQTITNVGMTHIYKVTDKLSIYLMIFNIDDIEMSTKGHRTFKRYLIIKAFPLWFYYIFFFFRNDFSKTVKLNSSKLGRKVPWVKSSMCFFFRFWGPKGGNIA